MIRNFVLFLSCDLSMFLCTRFSDQISCIGSLSSNHSLFFPIYVTCSYVNVFFSYDSPFSFHSWCYHVWELASCMGSVWFFPLFADLSVVPLLSSILFATTLLPFLLFSSALLIPQWEHSSGMGSPFLDFSIFQYVSSVRCGTLVSLHTRLNQDCRGSCVSISPISIRPHFSRLQLSYVWYSIPNFTVQTLCLCLIKYSTN